MLDNIPSAPSDVSVNRATTDDYLTMKYPQHLRICPGFAVNVKLIYKNKTFQQDAMGTSIVSIARMTFDKRPKTKTWFCNICTQM